MTKTITKVGNSQGIIFEAALMELAHLKPGDAVNVEVHQGARITLTPLRPSIEPKRTVSTAKRLMRKNTVFRRLS